MKAINSGSKSPAPYHGGASSISDHVFAGYYFTSSDTGNTFLLTLS
jgi:hypothetical protein